MAEFLVHASFCIEAPDLDAAIRLHDDAMDAAMSSTPECRFLSSTVGAAAVPMAGQSLSDLRVEALGRASHKRGRHM